MFWEPDLPLYYKKATFHVLPLACIPSHGANSYDKRTNNVKHSYGCLAKSCVSYGGRKKVLRILTTALRQSCKFARQLHGHLAAAVQIRAFLFPTFKLGRPCDPWDSRTSIILLPCSVYDRYRPVWTYCEFVRNIGPAKSYDQTNRTVDVNRP